MKISKKCLGLSVLIAMSLSANSIWASDFSDGNYQSIFYVNDIHGQLAPMNKINNAATQFETLNIDKKNVDTLMVSAGDIMIGGNDGVNKTSGAFLDVSNIRYTAVGNHEFDMGATNLSRIYKGVKALKLTANVDFSKNHPLKKQLITSIIVTGKSGEKYGLIGAQSPTLIERMKDKALFEGIKISGGQKAYDTLLKEVNKLEKQGVKRIIMLSHSGYEEEKEFAKNISGIDVIIGGHSHDLIFDITEGANLQYSPKGEPVIITQAGRDGKNFGILNVEYDKNGIVTKAQNNVFTTSDFNKGMLMTTTTNLIMGKSPVVAEMKYVEKLTDKMNIEENPYADTFLDMIRLETGADIVLMNSANFRGGLDKGNVTERDISGIFPFKNKMCVVELSEKALIDALNHGGTSLLAPDLKPSIIQISGMTYTLDKKGKVTNCVIYRNGKKEKIDVKNPSETKCYKAAYDDYLLKGGDGFKSLKTDKVIKIYDYDKDALAIEYLKKHKDNSVLIMKRDRRIKFSK